MFIVARKRLYIRSLKNNFYMLGTWPVLLTDFHNQKCDKQSLGFDYPHSRYAEREIDSPERRRHC